MRHIFETLIFSIVCFAVVTIFTRSWIPGVFGAIVGALIYGFLWYPPDDGPDYY